MLVRIYENKQTFMCTLFQALTEKTSDEERMRSVENELQRKVEEFAAIEVGCK